MPPVQEMLLQATVADAILRRGMPFGGQVKSITSLAPHFKRSCQEVHGLTCRGSAGFGKAFEHAGDRGWGVGPMQHDLTDAVRWAIDCGLADPSRIGIFGASYGGYATLAGASDIPISQAVSQHNLHATASGQGGECIRL